MLAAILAAVAFAGTQTYRLNTSQKETALAKVEIKQAENNRLKEDQIRAATAADDERKTADKERTHAQEQQAIVAGYEARTLKAERERAAALVERDRVSRKYASVSTFATRSDKETAGNCPTLERATDRLEKLGTLASQCSGLLSEGEGLLRERDRQVDYLKNLLTNDRALLEPEKSK